MSTLSVGRRTHSNLMMRYTSTVILSVASSLSVIVLFVSPLVLHHVTMGSLYVGYPMSTLLIQSCRSLGLMRMIVVSVSLMILWWHGYVIVGLTSMTKEVRIKTGCYVYVLSNLSGLKDITVRSVYIRHAKTLTMTDRLL